MIPNTLSLDSPCISDSKDAYLHSRYLNLAPQLLASEVRVLIYNFDALR